MKWTGEVTVMRMGKSYYLPPVFITVDAGSYEAACGAAAREGKRRLAVTHPGIRVEAATVKVVRVKNDGGAE